MEILLLIFKVFKKCPEDRPCSWLLVISYCPASLRVSPQLPFSSSIRERPLTLGL